MKYYYVSRSGPFRNSAFMGKDVDRINRDKNKIVITRIKGSFHVLICKKGIYEKEKMILSYFDLVSFLKSVSFNTYFVNVSKETVDFIMSYANGDEKVNVNAVPENSKEEFYAVDNENMYELEAYIKRGIIKKSIYTIYEKEINGDNKWHYISLSDFFDNDELFELYHLPFEEKNGHFLIPNYSYAQPKPFYILSGIYNKDGDIISLSSDDIKNICMIGNIEKEIASEILSNIELRIIEQQPLSAINDVADVIDRYNRSFERKDAILKVLREHIIEAKSNRLIFENLRLLSETREKEKELSKQMNEGNVL